MAQTSAPIAGETQRSAKQVGPVKAQPTNAYYRIFLNHLKKSVANGLRWPVETVGEVGPGIHVGIGISALLAGAERYIGLDLDPLIDLGAEVSTFDELCHMFSNRTVPQRDSGGPAFSFPSDILSDGLLERALDPVRLARIRKDLETGNGEFVCYVAPWESRWRDYTQSCDFIVSQSCLEHVQEIESAYESLGKIARDRGMMSHKIDFRAHKYRKLLGTHWNGHWTVGTKRWEEIVENDSFSLNRCTCSQHLKFMRQAGFDLLRVEKRVESSGIDRQDLHTEFAWMDDDDLQCSGVLVVSRKL